MSSQYPGSNEPNPYQAPPPMPATGYAPVGVTPVAGNSGLAMASMILGIVGLCTLGLTSIPAVICGHLGLSKINQSNGMIQGKGMAIAGLVLGYVGLAIIAFVFILDIAAYASR